jgi:hypothetical protein
MPPSPPDQTIVEALDGRALARALLGGEQALDAQRDALNAINVFPVPDGDTGTNMSLTMRAACESVTNIRDPKATAGDVAAAAAQGALMGARGNSGVILSQILAGFANAASGKSELDGSLLGECFGAAMDTAYRIVSAPREGTILTAIAEAAKATRSSTASAEDVLRSAAVAAQEAADRSPELLPMLKEAGVVDAGAQGLALMLAGMSAGLRNETIAAMDLGAIDEGWLAATRRAHDAGEQAGVCTEFVVEGEGLDAELIRTRLSELGDSLLVIGGGNFVRVHVHTDTPEAAFEYARSLGSVSREKTEDMESQFQALASTGLRQEVELAVVAVGAGAGIDELFRSLGASEVVQGGQTMNPSAGEISDAIRASGGRRVIVLPNNKNIVLAAQQAAAGFDGRVRVVETKSIPQGVAALVAMSPEEDIEVNVETMTEAIAGVVSGDVALAARATTLDGIEIAEGQPIALIDDELALAETTIEGAVRACVTRMVAGRSGAIVSLYVGEGVEMETAEALAEELRAAHGCDVEVAAGGQPHYPYLIGVE